MKKVKIKGRVFGALSFIRGDAKPVPENTNQLVKGAWNMVYAVLYKNRYYTPETIKKAKGELKAYFNIHRHDTKNAFIELAQKTLYCHLMYPPQPENCLPQPDELLSTGHPECIHHLPLQLFVSYCYGRGEYFDAAMRVLCKSLYWQAHDARSFQPGEWRRLLINYGYGCLYDIFLVCLAHCQNDFAINPYSLKKNFRYETL
jgi:hypothetical protein